MKKTLFDISNGVFHQISKSTINEINFRSSDKIEYSIIEKVPKSRVTVPKPRRVNENYFFEGCIFDDYDNNYKTIWSLYLATISHMAAHAKISDYTKYEDWMKNKTLEKCQKVIDFVEDLRVEEYLKKSFFDTWENISMIKDGLNELQNEQNPKNNEKFNSVYVKKSGVIQELKNKLSQEDLEVDEIVFYLDFLYRNQNFLPEHNMPYCMHRDDVFTKKGYISNIRIEPKGEFARIVSDLDDVWSKQNRNLKSLAEYQELAEDSHFDDVVVGSENLGEFVRLSDESEGLLKKIRTSARIITNIIDTPSTEDVGLMNMQFAIQREASKNQGIQFFEQDLPRKETENWLVIIDASASMMARFEKMKKAALCFSEAAEEINRDGKWGLYGFNNNFLVVKDHVEKYNQQTKARIGGIENSGFSLIPDAIDMGVKILNKDKESARKHLILISDGRPFGYNNIDECFKKSLMNARKNRINVIGVGVPKKLSKYFSFILNDDNTEESIEKFMKNYTSIIESMR